MAKKRTKKQSKNNVQKQNNSLNTEIISIAIIAVSIFFSISIYSKNGGTVGNIISDFFTGTFGYFAYILPILAIISAIYCIFTKQKNEVKRKLILISVASADICAIFHMIFNCRKPMEFYQYYEYCHSNAGGGILGASIGMPANALLGAIGAYLLFFTAFLILFILIFFFSVIKIAPSISLAIKSTLGELKENIANDIEQEISDDEFDIKAHKKVKIDKKKVKQAEDEIKAVEEQFETMPNDLTINTASGKEIIKANGEKEFIDVEMSTEPEPHLSEQEKEQLDSEIKKEMESTAAEKNDIILQYTYQFTFKTKKSKCPRCFKRRTSAQCKTAC